MGHPERTVRPTYAPEPVQRREKPTPVGGHTLEEPDNPFPVPQRAQRLRNSAHVSGGDLLNEPPLADEYIPNADNLRKCAGRGWVCKSRRALGMRTTGSEAQNQKKM